VKHRLTLNALWILDAIVAYVTAGGCLFAVSVRAQTRVLAKVAVKQLPVRRKQHGNNIFPVRSRAKIYAQVPSMPCFFDALGDVQLIDYQLQQHRHIVCATVV
jgi:hypothetical protein